ncbi:MAG: phosphopyruvate hydratase [Firmicutes bacterium]|nr:phosphopyruvate hydratase [Bacillota bacterium]
MPIIKNIKAYEILDSRGNPTVEVEMEVDNGIKVSASVPSGASTGSREALELRDKDDRYMGLGVLKAVNNVNTIIKKEIVGMTLNPADVDKKLLELDGTQDKSNLGANAILAVSLCAVKALAKIENKELYEILSSGKVSLPIPMMNILNGGKHADNNLDIQEFMIVPVVKSFKERVRCGSEIFHTLKKILKEQGFSTGVGDEGGFAPDLSHNTQALDLIVESISTAGYKPGVDVFIALDVAASEIYEDGKYRLDNKLLSVDEMIDFYQNIIRKYPIISIEDPFYEDDFEALSKLTNILGNRIMLVGDDYFVTNSKYLQKGIDEKAGNAILLKANQIGTVTEMIKTITLARRNNYKMVISHRSGETEDTFIADFAVGLNIPFIKTGSLSRGERIAKYNRLMKIESKLSE